MGKVNRKIEYMFTGGVAGAMEQVLAARGSATRTVAEQTQSGAEQGCDVGLFVVTPAN